jgi:hypothetical protein
MNEQNGSNMKWSGGGIFLCRGPEEILVNKRMIRAPFCGSKHRSGHYPYISEDRNTSGTTVQQLTPLVWRTGDGHYVVYICLCVCVCVCLGYSPFLPLGAGSRAEAISCYSIRTTAVIPRPRWWLCTVWWAKPRCAVYLKKTGLRERGGLQPRPLLLRIRHIFVH